MFMDLIYVMDEIIITWGFLSKLARFYHFLSYYLTRNEYYNKITKRINE